MLACVRASTHACRMTKDGADFCRKQSWQATDHKPLSERAMKIVVCWHSPGEIKPLIDRQPKREFDAKVLSESTAIMQLLRTESDRSI